MYYRGYSISNIGKSGALGQVLGTIAGAYAEEI
jgi:hypothetical protein